MPPFMDQTTQLLNGCSHEAERATIVAGLLTGLRNSLPGNASSYLTNVVESIYAVSGLLRDVADKCQIHISRSRIVIEYLGVLLPCLSRTLRDITSHYDDTSRTKDVRCRRMYHVLSNEMPGLTLPGRFILYTAFLRLLRDLVVRSQNFDLNNLDTLRRQILELRKARNIEPPAPSNQLVRRELAMTYLEEPVVGHWAESIFTQPLPSRREFNKGISSTSRGYGDNKQLGHFEVPADAQVLVKRPFDNDRVCIIFYLTTTDSTPWLFMRTLENGLSWVDILGAHELCIKRIRPSTLCLTKWDYTNSRIKAWADLCFITWEEMVLFYNTFVALKAQSPQTLNTDPCGILKGERKLFQAQILEGNFHHCLTVLRDCETRGLRLHVSVWDGEFKDWPVWTAFVSPSPSGTWVGRKSRKRVLVRNIEPYVFSDIYQRARTARPGAKSLGGGRLPGSSEAFEIHFVHEEAALRFKDMFSALMDQSATESSEDGEPPVM
ncbi:uncharacterized protein B0I36DRAFT_161075 [Microdochium trichocladiopsis]|uniref:Uncharacterized protein n=1 Tax=Microdochium trichocladiopsis TaxID=1682393 RepID=A0A9P8Y261_9PEZI|nr:uncharacterized protein B0I36DRAFT_161075 [Microdochium trichocladiopsis]KAH7026671.1 hypothetical protein B0I36DRAFT_161075 [Microdochium trichocladiopsis]